MPGPGKKFHRVYFGEFYCLRTSQPVKTHPVLWWEDRTGGAWARFKDLNDIHQLSFHPNSLKDPIEIKNAINEKRYLFHIKGKLCWLYNVSKL